MKRSRIPETPPSKREQVLEEVLVRLGTGVLSGVLFLFLTPLWLVSLHPWAMLGVAFLGFLVGAIGGDVVVRRRRTRR